MLTVSSHPVYDTHLDFVLVGDLSPGELSRCYLSNDPLLSLKWDLSLLLHTDLIEGLRVMKARVLKQLHALYLLCLILSPKLHGNPLLSGYFLV